jgi:hypothetical protein
MPCKHIFHKECLSKTIKSNCPLCRTPFDPETCIAVYEEQVDTTMRELYTVPVDQQPIAIEATSMVADLCGVSENMAGMTGFLLNSMERASYSMEQQQIGAAVQLFVDCINHCSRFGTFKGFLGYSDNEGTLITCSDPPYTAVVAVQQHVQGYTPTMPQQPVYSPPYTPTNYVQQQSPASPEPPAVVSPAAGGYIPGIPQVLQQSGGYFGLQQEQQDAGGEQAAVEYIDLLQEQQADAEYMVTDEQVATLPAAIAVDLQDSSPLQPVRTLWATA